MTLSHLQQARPAGRVLSPLHRCPTSNQARLRPVQALRPLYLGNAVKSLTADVSSQGTRSSAGQSRVNQTRRNASAHTCAGARTLSHYRRKDKNELDAVKSASCRYFPQEGKD